MILWQVLFPFDIKGDNMEVRLRISSPAELIIESDKREGEVTKHVITATELKSVPGTFGDPIKALQSLPGVSRSGFGDGSVVVRGAEGINTGFYVDGMQVPQHVSYLGWPLCDYPQFH